MTIRRLRIVAGAGRVSGFWRFDHRTISLQQLLRRLIELCIRQWLRLLPLVNSLPQPVLFQRQIGKVVKLNVEMAPAGRENSTIAHCYLTRLECLLDDLSSLLDQLLEMLLETFVRSELVIRSEDAVQA